MKKIIALSLSLMTLSSMAATTGTLLVKGTVAQKLSIEVTAEAIAATLPLDISQTDTKVAEVREKSNSNTGYKVTISSANLGNLKRSSGNQLFPYGLKYDGAPLNLSSPVVQSHSSPANANVSKAVTISYTGVPSEDMVHGEYSDTITFTIAAN